MNPVRLIGRGAIAALRGIGRVAIFAALGLVESRQGEGTFVSEPSGAQGMNAVFRVENRVYREFQMGRCAARLSVQHENAAAHRAAVICVIFALLILSLALSTTIRQPQREIFKEAHA